MNNKENLNSTYDAWMPIEYEPSLASIIIPTYNRQNFVLDALSSAYNQTYRPIEIIVVDDGSTDKTSLHIEKWLSEHPTDASFNFRLLKQENKGAPSARNAGLKASRGEYIQLLDSDDIIAKEKLEHQIELMKSYDDDVDYIASELYFFDTHYQIPKPKNPRITKHGRMTSPYDASRSTTLLLRRRLCLRAGPWNETLNQWQDWEYAFRILACRPSFIHLLDMYYCIRIHKHDRIGNLKWTARGIQERLHSLNAIQEIDKWDDFPYARRTITRLSSKLALEAIQIEAFKEASNCINFISKNKLQLFNFFVSCGLWTYLLFQRFKALLRGVY